MSLRDKYTDEEWNAIPPFTGFHHNKTDEFIICAAICNPEEKDMTGKNPLIYCGLRHAYILWQNKLVSRHPKHQGFITNKNRFVGREEARQIALKANQISNKTYSTVDLYSEDLY